MKYLDTQGHKPYKNHSSTRKLNSWTTRVGVGTHAYKEWVNVKWPVPILGLVIGRHRRTHTHMYIDTRLCVRIQTRGSLPTHTQIWMHVRWTVSNLGLAVHTHTNVDRHTYVYTCTHIRVSSYTQKDSFFLRKVAGAYFRIGGTQTGKCIHTHMYIDAG